MKVSEIGEFGLISRLARMVKRDDSQPSWQDLIIGMGDDAAAWQCEGIQLATTDLLIEGVHFPQGLTPWEDLGWRAMAANLSDIAAMGGAPRYALVSLAVPDDTEVGDVKALYRGMLKLAREHGVALVGGDTCGAPLVYVNLVILGTGQKDRLMTRSAAKPGDLIAVTGELGASAGGLQMVTKELEFRPKISRALRRAFFRPRPRITEGQFLVEQGVRAAIDISDGLVSDLGHICQASGVGARIDAEKVPVSPAVRAGFGRKARELALTGGEDYELLFTARPEVMERVQAQATFPVTVIGEMVRNRRKSITLVNAKGRALKLGKTGWEFFRASR